jgi:hypothetical protein
MPALHQHIQRLLLVGAHIDKPVSPPEPIAPSRLAPLIAAIAPSHQAYDARALLYGHRYRSGFWCIYLLSAIAVLCAVLPLGLGWDASRIQVHHYAGYSAVAEVCVIGTVSAIYWFGHRSDWQGEWLGARTTAELTWYLPVLAPLVDFGAAARETNWYERVFDPGRHGSAIDEVAEICKRNEALARSSLQGAWDDRQFVAEYKRWTIDLLAGQRAYHQGLAGRQHALLHRVHALNTWLFGLTALGALTHLLVHAVWLSLVTTFFPALGASLHGALAQSEAYRLEATSRRLAAELASAIDSIRAAGDALAIKAAIESALATILEEHQDWQMLVRPHHLPLA